MSTERCECSPPKFLSAFGRSFKHPSHYRDCPMYEEPNEEQKANARRKVEMALTKESILDAQNETTR